MARTRVIATRVPKSLYNLIEKYIELDTHVTNAEFFRDAIREKIRRDAPDLYSSLFKEEQKTTEPENLIFLGYDGVLYADAIRKKLIENARLERVIAEKMARIQAELDELERIRHSHKVEVRSAGIENGSASHRDKEAAGEVPELE